MFIKKTLFSIIKKLKLKDSINIIQNYECDKNGIVPPIVGGKNEKGRNFKKEKSR